jgi:hypothetical protein
MAKLVYIGGYGQSGSTVFEYLLTANPDAVACGEIVNGFRKASGREIRCSCGKLQKDCPVWSTFNSASNSSSTWTHEALVTTLLDHIASKYAILTDSSKTSWGTITAPFRLRRQLGQNFHLVHVVRDPKAVCWSSLRLTALRKDKHKRTRRPLKRALSRPMPRCLRTALGWWIANLSCELFRRQYPKQYKLVRYEDFVSSPREAIGRLFQSISPDCAWQVTEIGVHDNRHQLYANRMRRKSLHFSDIQIDVSWKTDMPRLYRHLAGALTWPLRTRYHY